MSEVATESAPAPQHPTGASPAPRRRYRRIWRWIVGGVVAVVAMIFGVCWLISSLRTVSTDDAYVNGHVTFVAARVPGQVARVLVDDNNRVRKGELLVQLDPEPYQVQLNIAQAAADAANSDLIAAQAEVRADAGKARAARFSLQHAIEDVDNQIALLHAKVATLQSQQAVLARAKADYERAEPLVKSGG